MIAQVTRGGHMPDLVSYLFGPGRFNEHVNQHLVAGYGDAVFTADDKLWRSEPGKQRHVSKQARELGYQVDYPRWRWDAEVPHGHVWHCSLSLKAEEGQLTDAQWSQAAHHLIENLGFSGADGKAPCRWIAVRHGPSSEGNDHVHVAVNLVREDGTKASTWHDYHKAGQACAAIEQRFGLQPVPGRITGRSVPEPSRKDRQISAARGEAEPVRVSLERTVRACAAAARSEAHFIALARARGLLIRPRYSDSGATAVTGYAVADPTRQARNRHTGTSGPIWLGGGKLASDLSLPSLRLRWETGSPVQARAEALAAWYAATSLSLPAWSARPSDTRQAGQLAADPAAAADLLAAAAAGCEPGTPGPLSKAARLMAKAAQHGPTIARRPQAAAIISDMASTFLAIASAASNDAQRTVLALVAEVAAVIDACVAKTLTTRTATLQAEQASVLVHASLTTLTHAADQQARTILSAAGADRKEVAMTDLTHEEELLSHLTASGVLVARLVRAAYGQSPGGQAPDVKALKAAGYREDTPFDEHLRRELGEQRWAKYVADPARIVCAALITDATAAGHDIPVVLTRAADIRAWEDDPRSPARSIARVLAYRIKKELNKPAVQHATPSIRTTSRSPASPAAEAPMPQTPWDDHLRAKLGEARWQQYSGDDRRRDVAVLLAVAHADGHDVPAMITHAVEAREWEDDAVSPSRRVGGVLHHRLRAAIASGNFASGASGGQLPQDVAATVAAAAAPASFNSADRPAPSSDVYRRAQQTRQDHSRDRE